MVEIGEDFKKLNSHDHLCLLYRKPEEWKKAVTSFLKTGLDKNEKCLYISGDHTKEKVKSYLKEAGINVEKKADNGQLIFLTKDDSYAEDEKFLPKKMVELLKRKSVLANNQGYHSLRVTGEISWALDYEQGAEKIIEYELKLNQDLFPHYHTTALCRYNLDKFEPEMIKSVIKTHPHIVLNNEIHSNPYYISPDKFDFAPKEVEEWIANIDEFTKVEDRFGYNPQKRKDKSDAKENYLKKAKRFHQRFLPSSSPEIDAISFTTYYQPAEEVGGDFYNYIQLDNKLIFYIIDITGHNLEGAMLNIFAREAINSYIIKDKESSCNLSPAGILEYIADRYRREDFPGDYFIALSIGVLDINNYELKISNLGIQVYPFFIDENFDLSRIKVSGLPITNTVDGSYYNADNICERSFYFRPGSTLLLTTDGLVEENKEGKRYADKRLKEVIRNNKYLSSELIKNQIISDFKRFNNSLKTKDDVTFLILQRNSKLISTFSIKISSKKEVVSPALTKMQRFISDYYDCPKKLIVPIQEVLLNAVEHGNQFDSSKKFDVEIKVTEKYIKIVITDQGSGFNWRSHLEESGGLDSIYDLENFEEQGRGLIIVKETVD